MYALPSGLETIFQDFRWEDKTINGSIEMATAWKNIFSGYRTNPPSPPNEF
jgi:hypothetical protein